MKKLFFTLVALVVAAVSYAQNTLVATLSHGDDITMYYGSNALKTAHDAATSGDVITLSGGTFEGITVTKGISIRGIGIDYSIATYIPSTLSINIPAEDISRFSMEGIRCDRLSLQGTFAEPIFLKCWFKSIVFYGNSSIKDVQFVNCKITESFSLGSSSTVQLIHCFVNRLDNSSRYSSTAQFINCVVYGDFTQYRRSTFVNSIICQYEKSGNWSGSNAPAIPEDNVAMNCVALFYTVNQGYSTYPSGYRNWNIYSMMSTNQVSCTTSTFEYVFKDFTGTYSDSQTFELTDEAKSKLLGTDGTEVGLYGGEYPYNSTPAYPRITKFNIAKQATADDKLSVEIEVSAAE